MTPDDFPKSAKDAFAYAKKHHAEMLDLKFVDMLGSWQHCSFPIDTLDEGTFDEGLETEVRRGDGVVALEGDAVCYTLPL